MADDTGNAVEMSALRRKRSDSDGVEEVAYEMDDAGMEYEWEDEVEDTGETYEPTDLSMGLGKKAAKNRLEVFGFNLNPYMLNSDPSHSTWPIFSLVAHTLASGLLSMGIYVTLSIIGGHWWQVGTMAFLLGGFLILAWYHTLRWRLVMRHMNKMLQLRSRVLRDGIWSDIPSRELVPGDIIELRAGKIVPCRCVVRECSDDLILDARSVLTDRLILTDISGAPGIGVMQIGPGEELVAGAMIKSGEAYRVQVLQTGPDTFLHRRYDDGIVSHLRRTRRKDLVYMATRSLIILVFIVFIVAIAAALLTTILSDRPLEQVLAGATFLIVFTAVHNPVGLVLRYARTEGARRVALRKGKRTGAALHSLTTVEMIAATETLAVDVRGFLASDEVKVTKVFPMRNCTASGLLIAAALATTPESQAAASPLATHHKAPVGDMEHFNMAILEELEVNNFRRKLEVADDALSTEITGHIYEKTKSKRKRSKSTKSENENAKVTTSPSADSNAHPTTDVEASSTPTPLIAATPTTSTRKKKDTKISPSSSPKTQKQVKMAEEPVKIPTIATTPEPTTQEKATSPEKASKPNKLLSALYGQPIHASTDFLFESSSDEDIGGSGSGEEMSMLPRKRRARPRTGSALRQSNKPAPTMAMSELSVHAEEDEEKSEQSLAGSVIINEASSHSEDEVIVELKVSTPETAAPPRRKRKKKLAQIEDATTFVRSSSSPRPPTESPYHMEPHSKKKLNLKGKDPCLNHGSGERNPMELSNYSRLGALFPPGCTVVHLQALSEEAVQYARFSNPVLPPSSLSSSLDTNSSISNTVVNDKDETPSTGRVGLKMATGVKRDSHPDLWASKSPRSLEPPSPALASSSSEDAMSKSNPAYNSFLVAKGDPRSVIRLCVERQDEALVNKIDALVKTQSERGRTVIAVAKGLADSLHVLERGPPTDMHLVGLLCFDGEMMADTSKCLIDAFLMGLNVKFITNEPVASASAMASKLGLSSNVITIEDYLANDPNLSRGAGIDISKADGFAEVTPENRIHLALAASEVSESAYANPIGQGGALPKKKKRTPRPLWGITSTDPSVLYEADIGITHRDETDVAVLSADVVLMQPGMRGLTRAIKEARKTLVVLEGLALVCAVQSLRNIITLVAAWVTYGFQPIPTTSLTILVALNLPMLMVVAHLDDGRVTRRPPSPFLIRRVAFTTFAVTLFEVIGAFLMGVLVYDVKIRSLTQDQASSAAFLWFGLANGFVVLLCRSPYGVVFLRPWPHPIILATIFVSQVIATILSVHGVGMSKIGIVNALIIWGYTLVTFLIQNLVFYASRLIWNRGLEKGLNSDSWFMMWHKTVPHSRWYRGLLTG